MEGLEFISAKRVSDVEVGATYELGGVPFTVVWTRMGADGQLHDFYCLDDTVGSPSRELIERVSNAISEGENGQDDEELYLFIRDKFDSADAEDLKETKE